MTVATPAELLRDLEDVGVVADDLWDLVNGKVRYSASAVPVLLKWLDELECRVPENERGALREGLVRALSVRTARPQAAPLLIEQFRRVEDPSGMGIRWAIGNALDVTADDSVFDELATLVRDRSFGKARQMIVMALGRSKHPRATPLLVELLDDDDVAAHALIALGRLRAHSARPHMEAMLGHPRALVRREAKKALAKLDD